MKHKIRNVEPRDLDLLMALCEEHATYEKFEKTIRCDKARLAQALFGDVPKLHGWLVEVDGNVAGYCTFTFDYSTWDAGEYLHMDCLFLQPSARGYGIGRAIMKQLEKEAQQRDCINMQWQTPSFNERAIRFYERLGASKAEKNRFTYPICQR
ncbi:GNAT family N-acetyltransferase [Chryseolinea lacunae]|uniref:GNAT family N-acetyltransferase n=1 Tax=Chryseolinea lacunae TaxID=2801331 RepID=A0ABS1KKK5_9BACT|nr:GNAT family N-acetyltransferase [Chryseolinea lacunae]MBL0739989.1 GNAT family N-acetyltransferase [Chryseolinea lacunae]